MYKLNAHIKKLQKLAKNASKYCVGMEGNISAKYSNGGILIKASGSQLGKLKKNDLVLLDCNDVQITNFDKKPSMELSFHKLLLGFDGVNFVSHTHPINTLKILCSEYVEAFANNRLFPDQVIFNGVKSLFVPYEEPGPKLTEKINEKLIKFITIEGFFPKLILLQNHGIISCGKTIDECIIINDICEKSAEIYLGAKSLGRIMILNSSNIDDLAKNNNEKHRQNLLK
jgi:ribulose-5-phosphate 4-epimerase/fuculose-1-phosphate aldolase